MPDKKRKFETKVHRKTLNPFFNETFSFKQVITGNLIFMLGNLFITGSNSFVPGSIQWDLRQDACLFLFWLRSIFKTRSGDIIQKKNVSHLHMLLIFYCNIFENFRGGLVTKKYLSFMFENKVECKVRTLLNLLNFCQSTICHLSSLGSFFAFLYSFSVTAKIKSTDGVFYNVFILRK